VASRNLCLKKDDLRDISLGGSQSMLESWSDIGNSHRFISRIKWVAVGVKILTFFFLKLKTCRLGFGG
jgi:hypothetical protein